MEYLGATTTLYDEDMMVAGVSRGSSGICIVVKSTRFAMYRVRLL
jgi:hypothetical protein